MYYFYDEDYIVIYLIAALINGIICGLITRAINRSKGWEGGFWWGFFLGIIGIIIVALQQSNNRRSNYYSNSRPGTIYTPVSVPPKRTTALPPVRKNVSYCPDCRRITFGTNSVVCTKCGKPMTRTDIVEDYWNKLSEAEKNERKVKWFPVKNKEEYVSTFKAKISGTELKQYIPLLEKNNLLDPTVIFTLTSEDLKEIGIEPLGDRKKLLVFIEESMSFDTNTDTEIPDDNKPETDKLWLCPNCGMWNSDYMVTCPDCLTKRPEH